MRASIRRLPFPHALLLPMAALATVTLVAGRAGPADEPALLKVLGFSAEDLQKISRGEVVGHTTEADASAVALSVAGTIQVPVSYYLDRLRAIESFKKSPEILQIGRFGPAPSPADLAALTLDRADLDYLKDCRLKNCGMKLDAQGIGQLARKAAAAPVLDVAMRQYLADYVQRYLQGGHPALIEYRDGSRPKPVAAELQSIVGHAGYLQQGWPTLYRAVADFQGTLPEGLDHFVYWSKEKIGPRAVISVTHTIISPLQNGAAAVATKQLYASHYSDGSLGVTMLFDKGTDDAPRTLVLYANRSRLDIFGGLFGSIKRPLVRSRARDGAERTMRLLRDRLERDYRAKQGILCP